MNQLSVCITNDELELIKQCIEFRLYMEKNHDNEKLEILYAKIGETMKYMTDDGKIFTNIEEANEHEKTLLPLDEYIEIQSQEILDVVDFPDGECNDDMDYVDSEFSSKLIELFTRMGNDKLVRAFHLYDRLRG